MQEIKSWDDVDIALKELATLNIKKAEIEGKLMRLINSSKRGKAKGRGYSALYLERLKGTRTQLIRGILYLPKKAGVWLKKKQGSLIWEGIGVLNWGNFPVFKFLRG